MKLLSSQDNHKIFKLRYPIKYMKFILFLISMLFILTIVSAQTYNFVDQNNIQAFECRKSSFPTEIPYPLTQCNILNNITSNNKLDSIDSNAFGSTGWANYGYYHYFKLKNITENYVFNLSINLALLQTGSQNTVINYLFVRDFVNNNWIYLANATIQPNTQKQIVWNYEGDITNFLLNGEMLFAATDKKSTFGTLYTDSFNANIIHCPTTNTTLFVQSSVNGNYENNGDIFQFKVNVTNIGTENAVNNLISIENVPSGWNGSLEQSIQVLNVGQSQVLTFIIERDSEDAEIYALAKACNSIPTSSDQIPIPIFWIVPIALLTIMVLIGIKYKGK